jgi:hypothetical protein
MADQKIFIIDTIPPNGPINFGKKELIDSLRRHGIDPVIVKDLNQNTSGKVLKIGTIADTQIQQIIGRTSAPAEAVFIKKSQINNTPVLLLAGSDYRGLMYALLETADQIKTKGISAIDKMEDIEECPENRIRGVDRYIQGHLDNEWFFSDQFWNYFLARLSRYRFNRFTLIMGFDTAFLTPPYPFFVEVPGYAQVKAVDPAQREQNLARLRRIGTLCHEYGLDFFLGTWQQTPWTKAQRNMVQNLPPDEESLARYCAAGMTALINACDTADGIQLRVNHESGVGSATSNDAFWKQIVAAVASAKRRVKLDIRAKGLSDDLLQYALGSSLQFAVPTKYWCEHTGLPYHFSRMRTEELEHLDNLNHSRRYSYADLLCKPQRADLIYRLWNYGSTCLFAWGSPDHARRFSQSCHLGGAGFEIDTALSLKGGHEMLQHEPWFIYKDPSLRSTGWEDERYWFRYLVYGRLGYSTKTNPGVWRRELEMRFGVKAAPIIEALYASASHCMPLITASHMPDHPSQWYWPEMSTGGALFKEHQYNRNFGAHTYGASKASDEGFFFGIDDYVKGMLTGKQPDRYTPLQVQSWLKKIAGEIRVSLDQIESSKILKGNLEYRQTAVDFHMIAGLAEYHVWKISAALHLSIYNHNGNSNDLKTAYACMAEAFNCWRAVAEYGSCYQDNLEFGIGPGTDRHGHWRDRLPELEQDVRELKKMLAEKHGVTVDTQEEQALQATETAANPSGWIIAPEWSADWPQKATEGQDLRIDIHTKNAARQTGPVVLRYRHTNQLEGEFRSVEMQAIDNGYTASIPGAYIEKQWDLMIYVSASDSLEKALIYPGLFHPDYRAPYHIITVVSSKL